MYVFNKSCFYYYNWTNIEHPGVPSSYWLPPVTTTCFQTRLATLTTRAALYTFKAKANFCGCTHSLDAIPVDPHSYSHSTHTLHTSCMESSVNSAPTPTSSSPVRKDHLPVAKRHPSNNCPRIDESLKALGDDKLYGALLGAGFLGSASLSVGESKPREFQEEIQSE